MSQQIPIPEPVAPEKPAFPWKKVLLEIVTIALGISLGFALERWNDERRDRLAESKILQEMRNGLKLDSTDIAGNIGGHEYGIKAVHYFRRVVLGNTFDPDSFPAHHNILFRGFIAIQNTSAYEALKAGGLETITNDSLRLMIMSVYDFDYQILYKLEEQYPDMQFMPLYFKDMMRIMSPFYIFDERGNLTGIRPVKLSETDRALVLTMLQRIGMNRYYTKKQYEEVLKHVEKLSAVIEVELGRWKSDEKVDRAEEVEKGTGERK